MKKTMEKKGIKQKISENLVWEKSLKCDKVGELLLFILYALLLALVVIGTCFSFSLKLFIFSYKQLFIFVISALIVDLILLISVAKIKVSVSQRAIKREAKSILERILFFKNQGKLNNCYAILSHEVFVSTPEELDQVISELQEIVGHEDSPDGGIHWIVCN